MSWIKISKEKEEQLKAVAQRFDDKTIDKLIKSGEVSSVVYDEKTDQMAIWRSRPTTIIDSKGVRRSVLKGKVTVLQGKGKNGGMMVPRAIEVTPKVRQIFRYICNGAQTPASITYGDLLGVAGGICTVVNSAIRLVATSMKIVKVTLWPPVAATGSNPSVSEINWIGANADQTPDMAYNETLPSGTATPGAIVIKPPKKSLAEDWFNNAVTLADVVFTLYTGQGTLIDLELEYTQPNGLLSTAITIATGALGVFYYLTLNHSGSKNIFPATLPNTT